MIEAIIGRESTRRRLSIIVGDQTTTIGNDYSVPQTVSRQQCCLIFDGDKISVTNLKPENTPIFVDGVEVIWKTIDSKSRVQIGHGFYNVDLAKIKEAIDALPQPTAEYSIGHLRQVWDTYNKTKLDMQVRESRKTTLRSLGSVFMMLGGLLAAIMPTGASSGWRITFIGIGLVIMIALLIPGFRSRSSLAVRRDELDNQLRKDYSCPNPKCKRFFGFTPYDEIRYLNACPRCRCKYHE